MKTFKEFVEPVEEEILSEAIPGAGLVKDAIKLPFKLGGKALSKFMDMLKSGETADGKEGTKLNVAKVSS